jgi:hypothetical protein
MRKAVTVVHWTCPVLEHTAVVPSDGGSRPKCRLCGKRMRKVRIL